MVKRRISFSRVLSSFHRIIASGQIIAIATFTISLSSCYNEPEFIGGDILPTSDLLSVKIDTSFEVSAYTVMTDSIPTSFYNTATLGCINSDVFGRTKADFLAQLSLSNIKDSVYMRTALHLDSSIFVMRVKKIWGAHDQPINVKIYELSKSLNVDSFYNGLESVQSYYNSQLIGQGIYKGDSLLRIKLSQAFTDKLGHLDSATFSSDTAFIRHMKGIYVTCDDLLGNEQVMYHFNYNGVVKLHYDYLKKGVPYDTIYAFGCTYFSPRFNHYTHSYGTASPSLKINQKDLFYQLNGVAQDSVFYLQGLGGVRGLIKLDGLQEWAQKMPITIHRAELRLGIQEHPLIPDSTVNSVVFYYNRLFDNRFTILDHDRKSLYDYDINGKIDYATYKKSKKYYSYDITIHLQQLLRGKIPNNYFFIEPKSFKETYSQGVFRTGSNSNRLKLIITYTKL